MAGWLERRRLRRIEDRWDAFIAAGRCQDCGDALVSPLDNQFVRCINGHPYDSVAGGFPRR